MPTIPPKDDTQRLAIGLEDVERLDPVLRGRLLQGKVDLTKAIRVGLDRVDALPALEFTCDLLVSAIVCDLIRIYNKEVKDPPCQIYIFKSKTWSRITNHLTLTCVQNGKTILNPLVFTTAKKEEKRLIPPAPSAVVISTTNLL